jgi:hypothetical protein
MAFVPQQAAFPAMAFVPQHTSVHSQQQPSDGPHDLLPINTESCHNKIHLHGALALSSACCPC